ncbi:hypothetical protein FSB78_11245 [Sphingomonas ginsenosidivorax]|uniref:Uncharacterized protein n=1 Tax=Sphingomonas ginsenosidivorax TaxID=862135 RepID=A0A5C6UFA7_9SPHN|nr:hypothetical protein [Sphingomonas ginsenosidivorax]TXC71453.1 hypothetical protein FSB78_11245 [Sphingomonas ginsenosidivorax]
MPRTVVDSVAAAVVRRLQTRGPRAGPAAARYASVAAPRRGRKPGADPSVDRLATVLASAVTRRLATGPAVPGIPLAASRLTRGIVRTVTRQLGKAPGPEPVALSTIDPAAAAKALAGALGSRQAAADPAAIVASTILRRLNSVRLVGTPADARAFQGRVASIVTASLRTAQAEPTAAEAEQPVAAATAAPTVALSDPPAAPPATVRKRD